MGIALYTIAIINTASFVVAVAAGIIQAHQRVHSEFISPLEVWSILTCLATWYLATFIILILRGHRIRVPNPIYGWWLATAFPVLLFSAAVAIFFL